MKKLFFIIVTVLVCGCVTKPPSSDKIFSNAQVQYQTKDPNTLVRKRDVQMPSYFFGIEYKPDQIVLNKAQANKMEAMLKKLVYPEEYKLYVSLGSDSSDGGMATIATVIKRGQYIKNKYAHRVKTIQVAYLKKQKPDSAYFRLIA